MNCKKASRQFQLNEWELIEIKPLSKIYRNKLSDQHCQEYLINIGSELEKAIFLKRMNIISQHLISVFYCEFFINASQCKQFNHYLAKIYIEKISIKLDEIIQLPVSVISQFLEETLLGFKTIFQQYQAVRIASNMIYFNQQNKVKVWISSNPLQNLVSNHQIITQQMMVHDIFTIFDSYTMNYKDRPEFMKFEQALNYLNYKKLIIYSRSSNLSSCSGYSINKRLNNYDNTLIQSQKKMPKFSDYNQFFLNSPKNSVNLSNMQQSSYFKKVTPMTGRHETRQHQSFQQNGNQFSKKDNFVKKQRSNVKQMYQEDQLMKCINQKKFPTINLESARTTSKTITLSDNLIELDKNQFQLQLIDNKKSKDTKLQMIQNAFQNKNSDQNLKKICKIYDHALRYDPIMYHQLQKAQGRISKISNMYILKRLIEITSQVNPKLSQNSAYGFQTSKIQSKTKRQQKINKILQQQRIKRNKIKKSILSQFQQTQSPTFVKDNQNQTTGYRQIHPNSKHSLPLHNLKQKEENCSTNRQHEQDDEQTIRAKIEKQKQHKQQIKRIEQFRQQFQRLLFE